MFTKSNYLLAKPFLLLLLDALACLFILPFSIFSNAISCFECIPRDFHRKTLNPFSKSFSPLNFLPPFLSLPPFSFSFSPPFPQLFPYLQNTLDVPASPRACWVNCSCIERLCKLLQSSGTIENGGFGRMKSTWGAPWKNCQQFGIIQSKLYLTAVDLNQDSKLTTVWPSNRIC